MKNSLDKKGLSMSEAKSISNICYQKALDISNQLTVINNFGKIVDIKGKKYPVMQGNPLPDNIVDLISKKAIYHATQAFLMENIKAKENLIFSIKREEFIYNVDVPLMGKLEDPLLEDEVDEEWGKNQLSLDEVNEFLMNEAQASHIGQFIHAKSLLDNLRKELPTIKSLEWMEIETGKKTPVEVIIHHTQEQLSDLYEQFSAMHREAESKVNNIKAKIKNLVSDENSRIAEVNAVELTRVNIINQKIREEYTNSVNNWRANYATAEKEFEANRHKRIKEASALKIQTAPQFKSIVDEILKSLSNA